jgi:hypothetical protein
MKTCVVWFAVESHLKFVYCGLCAQHSTLVETTEAKCESAAPDWRLVQISWRIGKGGGHDLYSDLSCEV